MSHSRFIEQWHGNIFTSMMINKSNLFLHSFRLLIAIIIATPYGTHSKILKPVAQNLSDSFRYITSAPERLSQPIAQLTLVIPVCHFCMPVQYQFNRSDSFPILFFTDGITFRTIKYIPDHLQTIFYRFMWRPACDWTDLRILRIFEQALCIRLLPFS